MGVCVTCRRNSRSVHSVLTHKAAQAHSPLEKKKSPQQIEGAAPPLLAPVILKQSNGFSMGVQYAKNLVRQYLSNATHCFNAC